jgi:hypothetical protein
MNRHRLPGDFRQVRDPPLRRVSVQGCRHRSSGRGGILVSGFLDIDRRVWYNAGMRLREVLGQNRRGEK